ncbi:MAG: hypothetical protein ABI707_17035 [Ferruginibacter sp.]
MLLNNRKRNWMATLILIIPVLTGSCYYDKEELLYPGTNTNQPGNCATTPASFSADVFPLITSKCAISGCHDATASGGHIFQSYNQIIAAKDMINVQVVIQKTMPETGALPPAQINIIRCWIEGGALNN